MTYGEVRALFPVLERLAYLNAGTFGPLSRGVMEAVAGEQRRDLEDGRIGRAYIERALALRSGLRTKIATFVSAEPGQVALTASTTDGCNIVLMGLDLQPGDEVVTTTDEHFGLLGPLHASGARVVVVTPDPEAILAAVTPRTKLIAISHVLWTTGQILPVRELRERSGVPVLVDAAQSVGAIPVDASGLDFLTISGQKWLCGPDATGALVVAEPERLRIGRPGYLSQAGYEPDGAFVPREGAQRFEPNWIPVASLAGLAVALAQVPDWGYERAYALAERLQELLAGKAEVLIPAERATLVAFRPPGDESAGDVVARLGDAGVMVREIPGTGLIRASVGWWTSEGDLDRLLAGLA
jgi:L-cysteine/cystine lyase